MRLTHKHVIAAGAATLALAVGVPTMASAATTSHGSTAAARSVAQAPVNITSPVTGTFTNADGPGTFNGTFIPTKFSVVNGVLEATGVLKGTLTDANGTSLGNVSQTVTMPVDTPGTGTAAAAAAPAACNILSLTLGPLDLNLLGLVVTLNQVHLNITAVPGAGNLLGNLLCAVANLLNGTGVSGLLGEIAALLNQILGLL